MPALTPDAYQAYIELRNSPKNMMKQKSPQKRSPRKSQQQQQVGQAKFRFVKSDQAIEECIRFVMGAKGSKSRLFQLDMKSYLKIWNCVFRWVEDEMLKGRSVEISGLGFFAWNLKEGELNMPMFGFKDSFVGSEYARGSLKEGFHEKLGNTVSISLTQISVEANVSREAVSTALKDIFRTLGEGVKNIRITDKIQLDCGNLLKVNIGYKTYFARWNKDFLKAVEQNQSIIISGNKIPQKIQKESQAANPEKPAEVIGTERESMQIGKVNIDEEPKKKKRRVRKKKKLKHSTISFPSAKHYEPPKKPNFQSDWKKQLDEKKELNEKEKCENLKQGELDLLAAKQVREETAQRLLERRRREQATMKENLRMAESALKRQQAENSVVEMGNIFEKRRSAHPTFDNKQFRADLENQIKDKQERMMSNHKKEITTGDKHLTKLQRSHLKHKEQEYQKFLKQKEHQKKVLQKQIEDRKKHTSQELEVERNFKETPLVMGHDDEIAKRSREINKELQKGNIEESLRKQLTAENERKQALDEERTYIDFINQKEAELKEKKYRRECQKKLKMKSAWDSQVQSKTAYRASLSPTK